MKSEGLYDFPLRLFFFFVIRPKPKNGYTSVYLDTISFFEPCLCLVSVSISDAECVKGGLWRGQGNAVA